MAPNFIPGLILTFGAFSFVAFAFALRYAAVRQSLQAHQCAILAIIALITMIFDVLTGQQLSNVLLSSDYLWVALIGLSVGGVELVARYRDNPKRALQTIPACVYMAINVAACVIILFILNALRPEWLFPKDGTADAKSHLYLVLSAGFGAIALFRSSLFKIKTNDGELAVGPAVILDTVLAASDRAVDRILAGPRGVFVAEIMEHVSFERAKLALPSYCFALMQNVSSQEQKDIGDQVNALATAIMDDRVRSLNLGLALINVVGERVLRSAVANLGPLIQGEPPIAQTDVARVAALVAPLDFAAASVLLPAYCFSLRPNVAAADRQTFLEQMQGIAQPTAPERLKNLLLGVGLYNLVGFAALELAIAQLAQDILRPNA